MANVTATKPSSVLHPGQERRGCVEIRWAEDGDPDDVVAPWPQELDGDPVMVHIERMSDGHIWLAIYDQSRDIDVHMDFTATKKNDLRWFVRPS